MLRFATLPPGAQLFSFVGGGRRKKQVGQEEKGTDGEGRGVKQGESEGQKEGSSSRATVGDCCVWRPV